jgi:hypothetical protein
MLAISAAVFAIAISEILSLETIPVVIGSLLPLASPLLQSIPIALVLVVIISHSHRERKAISLFLGWCTTMLLLSISGPVSPLAIGSAYSFNLIPDEIGYSVFVFFSGLIIYSSSKKLREHLYSVESRTIRKSVFCLIIAFFFLLLLFPVVPMDICDLGEGHNETGVLVDGWLCSGISQNHGYDVFELCQENCSVSVWSRGLNLDFAYGDNLTVSGTYTLKYGDPEIYKVLWVS